MVKDTIKHGSEVRLYQRNFVLTEDGEMVPYGKWYESRRTRDKEK